MQVKQTKSDGLTREFSVTVAAKDINNKVDVKLKEIAKKMKEPGFRPGKVPVHIAKRRHGPTILKEVLEHVVADASEKTLEEQGIRPAMQPKIEVSSFDDGKDLQFSLSVEMFPEIPEIDISKIALKEAEVEVVKKDMDDALERLLKLNREFSAPAKPRAAKKGDAVIIDYLGKVNNVPFDGGEAKDHRLELGSGQFIPGFEEQLIGSKAGDDKLVKVTFPENYHSKELSGKGAEFEVKVKEVLEPKEPKLDDEFAKKLGLESLEKLKEEIEKQIKNDFESVARGKLKKELFDALEKLSKFEVPGPMVEMELSSLKSQKEQQEKNPQGTKDKELEKDEKGLKALATRRVKLGILLAELGRKNKLEVSEDDLRKAVFEQARTYPGQEQKVIEMFQKNRELLEQLKGPILEDKVVNFIIDKAKVTKEKTTTEKLMKFFEEQ